METRGVLALWRACIETEDELAWARLIERLEPRLRRLARRQLRMLDDVSDQDQVDEVVQEVYCRLLANERGALARCRAESEAELQAYLRTTVRNLVVSRFRRRRATKRGAGSQRAADGVSEDLRASGAAWCPETLFFVAEAREQIRACCHEAARAPELGRRNAWIVERSLVEGWSSVEIAAAIGLRASSVQSVLHRFWNRFRVRGDRGSGPFEAIEKPVLP